MSSPRRRKPRTADLIPRTVSDPNFIHCLRMFPLTRHWAAKFEENQRIDFNSRNLLQMPVEIAEAFIRHFATYDGPLAVACRDVIAAIDTEDKTFGLVAQAGETRRAETSLDGSVHEHATAKADAP